MIHVDGGQAYVVSGHRGSDEWAHLPRGHVIASELSGGVTYMGVRWDASHDIADPIPPIWEVTPQQASRPLDYVAQSSPDETLQALQLPAQIADAEQDQRDALQGEVDAVAALGDQTARVAADAERHSGDVDWSRIAIAAAILWAVIQAARSRG